MVEGGRVRQAANGADTHLVHLLRLDGRLADLSGSHLHVLFLERGQNVGGRQSPAGHAHGVEPEAHGIFAFAEDDDVSHSGDAFQGVTDVHVHVIANEEAGIFAVAGVDARPQYKSGGRFGDGDAGGFYFIGKAAESGIDAILDIDGSEIDIASNVEGDGNIAGTVVAAGGGHVFHAFDTVYLLLDGGSDRSFDGSRVGAVVKAGDSDLRGRQGGELRHRKRGNTHGARENDQQRTNRGENGAPDKEINKHASVSSPSTDLPGCGTTVHSSAFKFLRCHRKTRDGRDQVAGFAAGAEAASVTAVPSTKF